MSISQCVAAAGWTAAARRLLVAITSTIATASTLLPMPLHAAQVTVAFSGVVQHISGPGSGDFHFGELVTGNYTLETDVADLVPADPDEGRYRYSLVAASATFHSSGLTFTNGWGPGLYNDVSVFNNQMFSTEWRDDVSVFAWSRISGDLIDGEAPCCMELDFFASTRPGTMPTMIDDDSVPIQRLPFTYADISLHTSSGWTQVLLLPAPIPEPPTFLLLFAGLCAAPLLRGPRFRFRRPR
jgi:hypothetical protein